MDFRFLGELRPTRAQIGSENVNFGVLNHITAFTGSLKMGYFEPKSALQVLGPDRTEIGPSGFRAPG